MSYETGVKKNVTGIKKNVTGVKKKCNGCKESGTYTMYNARFNRYGQLRDRSLLTCLMCPSLSDKPQQDH